jgi:sialidase-1
MKPSFLFVSVLLLAAGLAAGATPQPSRPAQPAIPTRLVGVARPLGFDLMGPFVNLPDGRVLAVDGNAVRSSADDGRSWSEPVPLFPAGTKLEVRPERALAVTADGTVVLVFIDNLDRVWRWVAGDVAVLQQARLNVWAVRSTDGGKSWTDLQIIQSGYCGAIRDMIVTHDGRIVVTSQILLPAVSRHATIVHSSTDNGRTWQAGNILDVWDQPGDHAGGFEPTVVQQNDRRLRMLIRTNHRFFWEAWSKDGVSWTGLAPSDIASAHAPGLIKRLASGRQLLVWNAVYGQRKSLHVAVSDDDGVTWSRPREIAVGGRISYPYLLERRPGELWITSMQGNLRAKIMEADLLKP